MAGAPMENKCYFPILEIVCDKCNGDGGEYFHDGESSYCYKCNGAGYVPTKAGEDILALVLHNLKLTNHDNLAIECKQGALLSKRQQT